MNLRNEWNNNKYKWYKYKNGIYGNIIIDSVRLYLPDHNTGDFMTAGTRSIQAEILLEGRRKITTNDFQAITPIRKLVSLNIENDGSGSSSVIGCGDIPWNLKIMEQP